MGVAQPNYETSRKLKKSGAEGDKSGGPSASPQVKDRSSSSSSSSSGSSSAGSGSGRGGTSGGGDEDGASASGQHEGSSDHEDVSGDDADRGGGGARNDLSEEHGMGKRRIRNRNKAPEKRKKKDGGGGVREKGGSKGEGGGQQTHAHAGNATADKKEEEKEGEKKEGLNPSEQMELGRLMLKGTDKEIKNMYGKYHRSASRDRKSSGNRDLMVDDDDDDDNDEEGPPKDESEVSEESDDNDEDYDISDEVEERGGGGGSSSSSVEVDTINVPDGKRGGYQGKDHLTAPVFALTLDRERAANMALSPLSLERALEVLVIGAGGSTKEQLQELLQIRDEGDSLGLLWQQLNVEEDGGGESGDSLDVDCSTEVHLPDSVEVSRDEPIRTAKKNGKLSSIRLTTPSALR